MRNKTRIVYIKSINTSFIRGDQKILEKYFDVSTTQLNQTDGKLIFGWRLVKLFFFLLKHSFKKEVIFISWFADYHSALISLVCKLRGKKSIIFIGGQEAICYPELKKGVYRKKFRGTCVKYALRNTDLIIANHKSLIYHENTYYNVENPHIDGIKHYVKGLTTKTDIIYNGVDSERIIRNESIKKQPNLILTVGTMNQLGDFYNKGFDLFIETAAKNRDLEFVLIGLKPAYLNWVEENYKVSEISNLQIIPSFCPQEILNEKYNKAKVFVQASITEGMPNTLSEAMLMECIPVGSNINGIPDAIGDTGIIIKHRKAEELEKGIREALKMDTGQEACKRVKEMFTFELREEKILQSVQEVIK